jgi:hypothetical protein
VTLPNVQHIVTGTLNPCTVPPIGFPPNPECDVTAAPSAPYNMTGAPSGHLVTTYAVAAANV